MQPETRDQARHVQTGDAQPPAYETLEGRISAQRALLARLIELLADGPRAELCLWLEERAILHDGQEDPGAVPVPGALAAVARADEFLRLRDLIDSEPGA